MTDKACTGLLAEDVASWELVPTGIDGSLAMSFRTRQGKDFAFVLQAGDAQSLNAALAEARPPVAAPVPASAVADLAPVALRALLLPVRPAPVGGTVIRFARRER